MAAPPLPQTTNRLATIVPIRTSTELPSDSWTPSGVVRLIFDGVGTPAARACLIQWKTSLMSGFNSLIRPN